MKVQITARHVEVAPAVKSFMEARVAKLEKFIEGITDVHVVVSSEKFRQIAELKVHGRGGVYLTATEESDDLKASFLLAVDKVQKQARRQSSKRIDRKRRAAAPTPEGEGTFEILAPDTGDPPMPAVIESRRFVVKPLTVEEAVLELDEEKAEFLVFRNASHGRTNVLYRRPDGNFGLIDPD